MIRRLIISLLMVLVASTSFAGFATFNDYKDAIAENVSDATMNDTTYSFIINQAAYEVAVKLRCVQKKDTVITSDGVSVYAINSDMLQNGIEGIRCLSCGDQELTYGLERILPKDQAEYGNESGCPQTFSIWGQFIEVYPRGTSDPCSLIVDYSARPTFALEDDILDVPSEYADLIIMYAKVLLYDLYGRVQEASKLKVDFDAAISERRALLGLQDLLEKR